VNDSTNKMIEMLQKQVSDKDVIIQILKRKNEVQSVIIKEQKKRYKFIFMILLFVLVISFGINIYNLTF